MNPERGDKLWLDLRFYPAVLLLFAYGLGALQAKRYDTCFQWLTLPIRCEQNITRPIVHFFGTWYGETVEQWKLLEGLERRKTPLSDHLHAISTPWTADYTLADGNHTLLFQTFEIFIALAYLTIRANKKELEDAHSHAGEGNYIWSPFGRAARDEPRRDRIFSEIAQPEIRTSILQAGFSQGDDQHLNLAIESIRRLLVRVGGY